MLFAAGVNTPAAIVDSFSGTADANKVSELYTNAPTTVPTTIIFAGSYNVSSTFLFFNSNRPAAQFGMILCATSCVTPPLPTTEAADEK